MSLYPIGTVVKIKDLPMEILITGYYPQDPEEKRQIYDYMGISAVVGLTFSTTAMFFDQDAIEEVLFCGYQDEEMDNYLNEINKLRLEFKV